MCKWDYMPFIDSPEFLKNLSKTKVLRCLKVMISKFCPAGHLILIFIRRRLPPSRTISKGYSFKKFPRVTNFSNKCSCTINMKSVLDLVGQFFLKMMLGDKKISGRGEIYHGWYHKFTMHCITNTVQNNNILVGLTWLQE